MSATAPACRKASVAQGAHLKDIPREVRHKLSRLRVRDDRRNIASLVTDWATIALAIGVSLATDHPFVYATAVVVIGSRQRALMNLVHEASHRKLFGSRRANDWAGKLLAAFPVLTGLAAYTCSHCRHHAALWDEARDPKTIRYRQLGLVAPRADRRFWWRHLVRPLALLHVPHNVVAALSWVGEPRSERVQRIAYWTVVLITASVLGFWEELALFWVVPYCTSFQVIRYWAEMAEHAGLRTTDPWLASRNWTSNALMRWLLLPHDEYHLIHHLFPGIPHYRMPEAHRTLMQVPQYAAAHHCQGFFWPRSPYALSVLQDIRHPDRGAARRSRVSHPAG
jgi:fatty acid desaturase